MVFANTDGSTPILRPFPPIFLEKDRKDRGDMPRRSGPFSMELRRTGPSCLAPRFTPQNHTFILFRTHIPLNLHARSPQLSEGPVLLTIPIVN